MNYIVSGTGLQKFQVLGIGHASYVQDTPSYTPEYTTKYHEFHTHPETGEVAVGLQSIESLPESYQPFVVDNQYLIDNGFKVG
jgi:hypothetical protein